MAKKKSNLKTKKPVSKTSSKKKTANITIDLSYTVDN